MFIYPYKQSSESAKALAEVLGAVRLKTDGTSKFRGNNKKVVINWGASEMNEEARKATVINKPEAVALCTNKLSFFQHINSWNTGCLHGVNETSFFVNIPSFTSNANEAFRWIKGGYDVVCRTKLNGHSGEGIVLYTQDDYKSLRPFPNAPLYTVYMKKKSEYRVHVIGGEVKDVVRKARRKDVPDEEVNWKIRNHANGFVFSRGEALGDVPEGVKTQALNAIRACGLDFGAVDIIYNDKNNIVHVLEINTAPGMEGETVHIYGNGLDDFIKIMWDKDPYAKMILDNLEAI
jgi:glutathione synthase/RimK-type ligase-like ATP-grasp enzyme